MFVPDAMRAVFAREPGGPDVLEVRQVPVPRPAAGEVLIRVEAAGLNRPDLNQRRGNYAPPPGITEILGLEVCGEIVSAGEGVDPAVVGRTSCALVAGGGYAEYCVAPVQQVVPLPKGLSEVEGAALPETFFTVWTNLFQIGRLSVGETVLIHGGTSGIGTTAIQLAKAFGARVICTAGTPAKVARCLEIGADAAIDYRRERFEDRVLEETGGQGVDALLDMVCAAYADRNLACLATGGRWIVIAFLGGGRAEIDIEGMIRRRQSLCGSTLRPQNPDAKGAIATELQREVWPLIESGQVRPVIHATFPLAEAASAHAALEKGDHVGKIVLRLADT